MAYVPVPIPEEFVPDVMQYVVRLVKQAEMAPLDEEYVMQLFDQVDELSRAVLSFIGRATSASKAITYTDVGTALQITGREVAALVRELNDRCRTDGRPSIIETRPAPKDLPNGRSSANSLLALDDKVARMVRDAERADASAARSASGAPG